MTPHRIVVPALSFLLAIPGLSIASASGLQQDAPRSTAYAQDRLSWDAPPQDVQQIERQGFRDGIEGARRDLEKHRLPDVNNRDEYRDPRLPPGQQETYRDGFRLGYERAASHIIGGPQEPVGPSEQQALLSEQQMREPDRGGPDMGAAMGQGEDSEIQHRGFQDGMEGARNDVETHHRSNVNKRDEYRHPKVSREFRDEYREAFRHGYDRAMAQQTGGGDRR
jgi:hypothetical protein